MGDIFYWSYHNCYGPSIYNSDDIMKHFRYTHLEDYLEKTNAYPDPKTIKIFSITRSDPGYATVIYAIVNLHSSCIDYRQEIIPIDEDEREKFIRDIETLLEESGHKQGKVIESSPVRF